MCEGGGPPVAVPKHCCPSGHASDEGGGADEAAEVVAKQPKRKRPPKKTVEQNLSNINSAESERRCEVQGSHDQHQPTELFLPEGSSLTPWGLYPPMSPPGGPHVPADGLVLR